eukprot:SAG11_NODE_4121_length_2055_cov_3.667178_4_plen_82_part_00
MTSGLVRPKLSRTVIGVYAGMGRGLANKTIEKSRLKRTIKQTIKQSNKQTNKQTRCNHTLILLGTVHAYRAYKNRPSPKLT